LLGVGVGVGVGAGVGLIPAQEEAPLSARHIVNYAWFCLV